MPAGAFDDVFAALRAILEPYASQPGFVHTQGSGKYQLSSAVKVDHAGRPLSVAGVEINKRYVSFHLMPIYMNPALQAAVSPALKRRMQGKSCFNLTAAEPELLQELAELTRRGIAGFKDVKLPWETNDATAGRSARARSARR
jgi:hypothetical protein